MIEKLNNQTEKNSLEMYFNLEIATKFAELEQNEKNFQVAKVVDLVTINACKNISDPLHIAELGGGAHPDRYDKLFNHLIANNGTIDWVDASPFMLDLAKKYLNNKTYSNRESVINFIENDVLNYLSQLPDNTLDVAIMKYVFQYIKDSDKLISLLGKKLKNDGKLIATIGNSSPILKSYSTNARFLYNDKEFPDNETRELKDGDAIGVKFFKISGDHESGYLKGAETITYYHSPEKIKKLAKNNNLECFIGDWKKIIPQAKQENLAIDQEMIVLTKDINMKNINEINKK